MIRHHPDDALLLAHAAGSLPAGAAIVVESHLEACPTCCDRLHVLQAVGGALLEDIEPVALQPDALTRALAAIDGTALVHVAAEPAAPLPAKTRAGSPRPELPAGTRWPRALEGCTVSPWRWLGPGMRWSRVTVPHDRSANVFLLRIGAGKRLPQHTHSDLELTQVLYGTFGDDRSRYGPGDFDGADGDVVHQPVVAAGEECICLTTVQGRVLFKGAIARTVGALVGM
ncbi:ChrR family anti-sigma-E factor [Paracidovorax wautersii]|uniref:Transcriptional regulator n=1 Tax=Paracidovorax wautersii TaxID=1177982 RepID=A0ABU1I7J1_9BURK|nr:ChrR family anti-sigma-E factor [Paracidovorax wautersii]MDR6213199.1 putative transcriptional regulator [Paracidovorax wautersii]